MKISASFYAVAKRAFWAMPAPLRDRLHGARHNLVRWLRIGLPFTRGRANGPAWAHFQAMVLGEQVFRQVFIFETNLDWNITLYQRPHHMALALGRLNCLVLYKTSGDGVSGFQQVAENVWLTDVDQLPIEGAVRCFYSTSIFATGTDLLKAGELGLTSYEYIDHIDPAISGGQASLGRLQELKQQAFASSDLIVSSAALLQNEAQQACGADRCVSIPNGVDLAHYRNASHRSRPLEQSFVDFRERYPEVVGYFGAIAPWLWYELIAEVATRMPEKGFVFIGPDYSGCVPRLPRRDNVLYLGPVDYQSLPCYAAQFDVCFIPFVKGEIARSTSPLKLFEYFALEKPVVVTSDMLECTAFEEVLAGGDAHAVANAIDTALELRQVPEFKKRLSALAEVNSWDVRAETYIKSIENLKNR
ncbi:glycosyltransferase family 1 protein [Pseudomonas putida]|uniref:glycosyltransferase n=1 Tax=Pseudomonas putida TaxID=303 RepID=UPI00125FBDC6|nr:glycosyltransferase [Pseudomonas putida]KAB5619175.1 glycosyltransferase family 1 protein [Pseudomonas putida]